MNTLGYIDLYCERTGPGFWNEPVNALTNLAFVIAALVAWHFARRRGGADRLETIAILLAAAIGLGSFLFHTLASSAAEYGDTIPIWSFVAWFVGVTIYRMSGQDRPRTFRIIAIAAGITALVFWLTGGDVATDAAAAAPMVANGSLQYAPAIIALGVFAILTRIRNHPAQHYVLGATLLFLVSLVFRTIDLVSCEITGIGTHFMWHLLNGAMVGLLLLLLVLKLPPGGARA